MKTFFRIRLAFIVLLLSLASCRSVEDVSSDANWSIRLSKGGCLDVCKSYTIEIDQSGSYIYKGKFNVPHIGNKEGVLDLNAMKRLESLQSGTPWQDFDSIYGSASEDSPTNQITYTTNSEKKTIVYYRLEPQELREIESVLDSIIEDEKF